MSGIKANWHLDLGNLFDSADPFGGEQLRIEDGDVIDLSSTTAVLRERLNTLLKEEGRLWNADVRCSIKQDYNDTSCSACPLRRQNNSDPLHELCEVGVAQEKVLTMLRVRQEADGDAGTDR